MNHYQDVVSVLADHAGLKQKRAPAANVLLVLFILINILL